MGKLHFSVNGEGFTKLLRDFVYEGRYSSVISTLQEGGFANEQIKDFFFHNLEFCGDTSQEEHDITDSDDVVGIQKYGRKSSIGNIPGKGGDIRPIIKSSRKRKAARRFTNHKARSEGKKAAKNLEI